jgi:PKD repeat protein
MPRRSSVGALKSHPAPGQAGINIITQEEEAQIEMEEAVTELFETDPTTPEYQEILTRVNKFSSIAENPFLANVATKTTTIVEEKQELQTQIVQLEDTIASGTFTTTKGFNVALKADVEASAVLDFRYLQYMQKYGPPTDGIFDPVLLAEFIS